MPGRIIDLLFRFLYQNEGRLSDRAWEQKFAALSDDEAGRIERLPIRSSPFCAAPHDAPAGDRLFRRAARIAREHQFRRTDIERLSYRPLAFRRVVRFRRPIVLSRDPRALVPPQWVYWSDRQFESYQVSQPTIWKLLMMTAR